MFDPTQMSPDQRDRLLAYVQKAARNPIHMFEMRLLGKILTVEEWIKSNCPAKLEDFTIVWQGVQAQIDRECRNFERELLKTLGAPDDQRALYADHREAH